MRMDAMSTSDLVNVLGFARVMVELAAVALLAWWFNRRGARCGGPR
jgi:hypothetical protein